MKKLFLFLVTMTAMVSITAQTQIWHVAPADDNGDPTGSGTAWLDPCSISFAIQFAADGDEIWMLQGYYHVNLIIDKKLKIYGGFNGTESSLSDRTLTSVWDYSVLMPQHIDTLSIINVNPNPHAFSCPDSALWPNKNCSLDSFLLDGFRLKAGKYADIYHSPGGWGAAIRTDSVNHIILKNLWVDSNLAFKGGGVYIENSAHGWMENILYTRNYAYSLGGGAFLSKCFDFTLINNAFTVNIAERNGEGYPGTQISSGFYLEEGEFYVHNMTAHNNYGPSPMEIEAGTINKSTVWFYNSIIWPDKLHIFYNHDNTVWFNNCCLWTTNQQQLQGWNPIPVNGNWSNVVWNYDIHNTVVTDNIHSIDPLFNYTQLIPTPVNLNIPELSSNSQFKDAAEPYESAYPGDIFDVMRRHRFEDHLDWGAFECQQNNRTLRLHAATGDDDRYIYVPLPSADTAVYYITSDSTVSAGSPTTHYFLNHTNIKEPNVVIPETVEHLGKTYKVIFVEGLAFYRDTITSVTLPRSIEAIGSYAFRESTLKQINPLYCKRISNGAFDCEKLMNLDLSNCPIDTFLDAYFMGNNRDLQWVKLPRTLVNFGINAGCGLFHVNTQYPHYFVIIPSRIKHYNFHIERAGSANYFEYPTIFLSNPVPSVVSGTTPPPADHGFTTYSAVWWPCEYDSVYRNSYYGDTCFKNTGSYHFLNLDSGYVDLDSVCPWEAERRYGFHPDSIGLYIVQKSNPDGCDSFNIYFVKSFLDPGVILDTTIQLEVNQQDTSVLWTWEGNAFAYNVYRDGDYLTTVEQPAFADSAIRVNVQYCYNFAPVNEKGCEGKWSTTNCYTMLGDSTGIRERGDRRIVIHPNPAREVLLVTTASAVSKTGSSSATHFDGTPYEITDITGRIVLQGQYNASEGIRVSDLAKGIYLLRMEGLVGKFVKE